MTDKSAREAIATYLSKKVFTNELCSDGDCADGDCQGHCAIYEIDGCGHADAILAALEAGGFAVVPVKPTPKMIEAAQYATFAEYERHPLWEEAKDVIENIDESAIWSAMLAASNPKEEGSENR